MSIKVGISSFILASPFSGADLYDALEIAGLNK